MSTKTLSPTERLALTSGSVINVKVIQVDDLNKELQVSLQATHIPLLVKEKKSVEPKNSASKVSKSVAPGPLLSSLKTGMKLEGVVASSTPYAAFLNCKIYRLGKGGSYCLVNGMLHKSDYLLVDEKDEKEKGKKIKSKSSQDLLTKGQKISVYVKEVYKNSGRFTLTTDATIEKAKILEVKEQSRQEGKDRRRGRRLRRQLEGLVAGDLVSGVVERVVAEGVLVTVTSLG